MVHALLDFFLLNNALHTFSATFETIFFLQKLLTNASNMSSCTQVKAFFEFWNNKKTSILEYLAFKKKIYALFPKLPAFTGLKSVLFIFNLN